MGFKKGYKPTEEHKRKNSETRKRLFAEGKLKSYVKREDIRNKSEEIIRLYQEELVSTIKIANKFKCSNVLINNLLNEWGIVMDGSKRKKLLFSKGKLINWAKGLTKETDERIAKCHTKESVKEKVICGYCHKEFLSFPSVKAKYCSKLCSGNSKIGKVSWNKGLTKETDERVKKYSKPKLGGTNNLRGKTYKEIYGQKYQEEIEKRSGRKHSEDELKRMSLNNKGHDVSLDKNPMWRGGKSFEPYTPEFNIYFKNLIRKRDNQSCMNCGVHREKLKRALGVHHINYDKELTIPENCICLCDKCHSLTNINREYWTKLFQEKLTKLYGYKYDEKGNVIINLKNTK